MKSLIRSCGCLLLMLLFRADEPHCCCTAEAVDYCASVTSLSAASRKCTETNCLCRLQAARLASSNPQDFTSIEEGCFREQSCPNQQAELTISEPIHCTISAQRELSFTESLLNFDSGTVILDDNSVQPDNSGSGSVFIFPAGLHAGQEISIRYQAAGSNDLVLGIGISAL